MKHNLTELVFILDRSGSMQGLEGDTLGGFNAMIDKQKKEPGEAFVSTVLFDDLTEVLHDRVKLGEVRPITEKEYYVRGCTALLDAIGGAMLAPGDRDHILSGVFNQFLSATPRASRINKKSANNPALID